jgi:zinc protease
MSAITYTKITLDNGMDVILHKDKSIPMVAVNVWYHVGSKDEELGKTGFAHLFEHMMFEGSKHHNENHFEPLQKVGASLNGSTNMDRTNYWENVPSNYLELALWLEADRMGYLLDALTQERLDNQREVVKNERRQTYENRPYGMAHWNMQGQLFPAPHPYNWMTIGSQADLDSASLEDVQAFFTTSL